MEAPEGLVSHSTGAFWGPVCQSRYQVRSTHYWVWPLQLPYPSRPRDLSVVPTFNPPNFDKPGLASAPDARFAPAPADGVLPEGFFSTTNLPTYVRIGGQWRLP